MFDMAAEIQNAVRQLKNDRDTWEAIAFKYKDAFEAQTKRLDALQDICFATQAELENERAQRNRRRNLSDPGGTISTTLDGSGDPLGDASYGSAIMFPCPTTSRNRKISCECNNPLFARVQDSMTKCDYGTALVEIEKLLRGPLSPKARAEGLILKSTVLEAAGPDELYAALATCSEAVELCNRLSELETFLPQIQYQRNLLYYQLHMLHQAKDMPSFIDEHDTFFADIDDSLQSSDGDLRQRRTENRRSGFDEHRTFSEGLLVHLDEKHHDNKRRRSSAQLRFRAAMKAKRVPIPSRWVGFAKCDAD